MNKIYFIFFIFISSISNAQEIGLASYSSEKICESIYIIEGKEKANQPYGINPKYIKCDSKEECYQICLNTVNNNKIRFKNQRKEKEFLTFLAKRYCPPNWKVWLKNLKFYLK